MKELQQVLWEPTIRYPIIAFIGADGAGKTTSLKFLGKKLIDMGFKVEMVNMHLAEDTILPIREMAVGTYKKIGDNKPNLKKKIIYTCGAFAYALDIWLRAMNIRVKRNGKSIIILTDRWAYDIYLMRFTPRFIRSFLLFLMPKPDMCFYLYNDLEVLHTRRPEQTIPDLMRQITLYDKIIKRYECYSIKTDTFDRMDEILGKVRGMMDGKIN